jgi:ArsR family transcriptional regulator
MDTTLVITKALADSNRLRVIMALSGQRELCLCQLTALLGWTAATVSRHMSVLQNARLVKSRKEGRWVHYRLAEDFPEALRNWLAASLGATPEVASDRERLREILACGRDELCRRQKGARDSHGR